MWRDYLKLSEETIQLEHELSPTVIEHDGGIRSTANTDIEKKLINLDVSQPPEKTALSYAYELMNLKNHGRYQTLISQARCEEISAAKYVKGIVVIEAEAAIFRCKVFLTFGLPDKDYPSNPKYLEMYKQNHCISKDELQRVFQMYILENGTVRRGVPVKKFYLNSYQFYTGKQDWPKKYDTPKDDTPYIPVPPSK